MKSLRVAAITLLALTFLAARLPARASDDIPPVSLGPDGGWIDAIALSPTFSADGYAWAAPFGGHLFLSSDGAHSWEETKQGESDPVVTGITPSPNFAADRTLYAAADDGVFRSTDGGLTWATISTGLNGHFARSVLVANRLYAATDGGVYTFDGTSWPPPANDQEAITTLAAVGGTFYAGPVAGGLIASSDGVQWSTVSGFPSDHQALFITGDGQSVLVGTDDGVWSGNAGGWQRVGLAGERVPALAVASDGTAFAASGSGHGVFVSHDGVSWQSAGSLPSGYVVSLAISPSFSSDHTVFAGTAGNGLFVSRDGGASWQEADAGLHAAQIVAVANTPRGLLAAGQGGAALYDGSWHPLALPDSFIETGAARGNTLFIGMHSGLQVSYDGGLTWQAANVPAQEVTALGIAPGPGVGTVLAADGWVYRSDDGGQNWQQTNLIGNDVRRFAFSPTFSSDGIVFAATITHRIMRSTDGGRTWATASNGLPAAQITDVLLSPRFASDHTVYAATSGYGIYRSTDGGDAWSPLPTQPPIHLVTALLWSPTGTLLAGTEKGLFTFDGSWQQLGGDWDEYITTLAFDSDGNLLIGTLGSGVWRLSLAPPLPTATLFSSPTPQTPPPTLPPTPLPPPTAPSLPAPPSATPTPLPLHPRLRVFPIPLQANQPALLLVRGPGGGIVHVTMTAGSWQRSYQGRIPADGFAGFGFIPPPSDVTFVATVQGRHRSGTARLTVHVVR